MRDGFKLKDEELAYGLLRAVLGMNLAMHGVARMLMGPGEFAWKLLAQFAHTPLPHWSVWPFAVMLPFIEGLLGVLLLVGLRTRAALVGAAMLMLVLTFGSGLVQDWQAAGLQLMYAAIVAALLGLRRFNGWSVDAWMGW